MIKTLFLISIITVFVITAVIYKNYQFQNIMANKTLGLIDLIVIEKQKREMHIYYRGQLIKTYQIALGFSPIGHKEQEGDGKTPEGKYSIISKNPRSRYHLSLKISYPNDQDLENAKKKNVSAGNYIMIHGLGKSYSYLGKDHINHDWTEGCIAVTNEEIEEIYPSIEIGTPIEIWP